MPLDHVQLKYRLRCARAEPFKKAWIISVCVLRSRTSFLSSYVLAALQRQDQEAKGVNLRPLQHQLAANSRSASGGAHCKMVFLTIRCVCSTESKSHLYAVVLSSSVLIYLNRAFDHVLKYSATCVLLIRFVSPELVPWSVVAPKTASISASRSQTVVGVQVSGASEPGMNAS